MKRCAPVKKVTDLLKNMLREIASGLLERCVQLEKPEDFSEKKCTGEKAYELLEASKLAKKKTVKMVA